MTASGAHDLVAAVAEYTFAAAPAINNLIEMLVLPAGHVLVDALLDADDLDTGTTLSISVGTMAGDPGDTTFANRTLTENIIAANTSLRAAAAAIPAAVAGFSRIAPSTQDVSVGVKIVAAPTGMAGGEKMRLTLLYRPKVRGI